MCKLRFKETKKVILIIRKTAEISGNMRKECLENLTLTGQEKVVGHLPDEFVTGWNDKKTNIATKHRELWIAMIVHIREGQSTWNK